MESKSSLPALVIGVDGEATSPGPGAIQSSEPGRCSSRHPLRRVHRSPGGGSLRSESRASSESEVSVSGKPLRTAGGTPAISRLVCGDLAKRRAGPVGAGAPPGKPRHARSISKQRRVVLRGERRRERGEVLRRRRPSRGPPMSIISTASSSVTPGARPLTKGYKFTQTSRTARSHARSSWARSPCGPASERCLRGCRVERLHAPLEQLGKPGQSSTRSYRQARSCERRAVPLATSSNRAPRARGKGVEAGLVVDGDQRAHSSGTTLGTGGARPRGRAGERFDRVPAEHRAGSLLSPPPSRPLVHVVHRRRGLGRSRREQVPQRMSAGESRERRGWMLTTRPGKRARERRGEEVHEPRADDELDSAAPSSQSAIATSRRPGPRGDREERPPSRYRRLGSFERLHSRLVGRDGHDGEPRASSAWRFDPPPTRGRRSLGTIVPMTSASPGSGTMPGSRCQG